MPINTFSKKDNSFDYLRYLAAFGVLSIHWGGSTRKFMEKVFLFVRY